MVYKLDLDDPRLGVPVPVYHRKGPDERYGTKEAFPTPESGLDLVWYAPDRATSGTMPVYQWDMGDGRGAILTTEARPGAKPVFYALSAADGSLSTVTMPLHEFRNRKTGERAYSTAKAMGSHRYARAPQAVCRVWPSPIDFNPYGSPDAGIW
jgi:hypothetical protein